MKIELTFIITLLAGASLTTLSAQPGETKTRRAPSAPRAVCAQPSGGQVRQRVFVPEKALPPAVHYYTPEPMIFMSPAPDPSREQGSSLEQGHHGSAHRR